MAYPPKLNELADPAYLYNSIFILKVNLDTALFLVSSGRYTKFMRYILTVAFLVLPSLTHAASIQEAARGIVIFGNRVVIPFLIGIGFLFLVINVFRYFIVGGSTDDGQKKAKNLALYSVAAMVLLVVFWGIVNIVANSLGLGYEKAPTPDYVEEYRRR